MFGGEAGTVRKGAISRRQGFVNSSQILGMSGDVMRTAIGVFFGLILTAGVSSEGHCGVLMPTAPGDSVMLSLTNQQLFVEGSILMEEGFWNEAERVWDAAINRTPNNRVYQFKQGLCLLEIGRNWNQAREAFQAATSGSLTQKYDPFNHRQKSPPLEALLFLAEAERRLGQFEQAKTHIALFNRRAGRKHPYTEYAERLSEDLEFAARQLENPTPADVSLLNINGEADETHPMLTVDGRTMFFSSNRSRSNGSNHGRKDPNTLAHYADVYRSTLLGDSTWSEPEFLNLGASYHAEVVGTDAFGEQLLLQDHDGWTYELKTTAQWERGWTASVPFIFGKNRPTEGEVAFFPSEDRIVVALKQRRGEGGFDLYECALDKKGRWGKPESLGDEINTFGDELSPFIAADGQTLFFASNGLPTIGGFDIYRSVRQDDGTWSKPKHMGSPINSVEDELNFVMGAKGELGYFASRRETDRRDLDLYEVRMNATSPVEGNVMILTVDASEEMEIADALVLRDARSGEVLQFIDKCAQSRMFKLIVPAGGDYILERAAIAGEGANGEIVQPAIQRRINVPSDARPEVVDVAFAEMFAPELDSLSGSDVSGLELPPFVIRREPTPKVEKEPMVEEVVDNVIETNDEEVLSVREEMDAEDEAADMRRTDPDEIEDLKGMSLPSAPVDLANLSGNWYAYQIGAFRGSPRQDWLARAGEQLVYEELPNGMVRWYAGVSQDAEATSQDWLELRSDEGFQNSFLVRLENGQRMTLNAPLQDPIESTSIIRPSLGLDGQPSAIAERMVGSNMSSPIAPLALDMTVEGELLLAIQFFSNQVHTARMSIEPLMSRVLELSKQGRPLIRIEGSASTVSTSRERGNWGLAADRASNVYVRVVNRLEEEGLREGDDYSVQIVKRVQPDDASKILEAGAPVHPASFQYVRVDVELQP